MWGNDDVMMFFWFLSNDIKDGIYIYSSLKVLLFFSGKLRLRLASRSLTCNVIHPGGDCYWDGGSIPI